MLEISLKDQEFLKNCTKSQSFIGISKDGSNTFIVKDIGDGIFEVFVNLYRGNCYAEVLNSIGYLVPAKGILAYPPSKEISMEKNAGGKSILNIVSESEFSSLAIFSQTLLKEIIEILFDSDGNSDEDELSGIPGGNTVPIVKLESVFKNASRMFELQNEGKEIHPFSKWVQNNLRNNFGYRLSRALSSARVLEKDAARYLLLGKPIDLEYQLIKKACSQQVVEALNAIAAEYVETNHELQKIPASNFDIARKIQQEISVRAKTSISGHIKVKTSNGKTGSFLLNEGVQHINPLGVYMQSVLYTWAEVDYVKVSNRMVYKKK